MTIIEKYLYSFFIYKNYLFCFKEILKFLDKNNYIISKICELNYISEIFFVDNKRKK